MSDTTDTRFSGAIPDIYDEYLVPLIFQPYADDMAARVAAAAPMTVLETAAGSGVVTRALAPLLPKGAAYTVTDLNPPMLDRARRRQPDAGNLTWQQADALALPFDDATFDAVCCQFGAMFFPDKLAGYREALRVLRPGGRFVVNTWDRIEANEFAESVTATAARFFPDDPPRFLARTPHGYHDREAIAATLRQAGFATVEAVTLTHESRAASPRVPAVAYCQGTPLRNELEARDASLLDIITDAATADIAARFGKGAVSGRIQGHVFTAVK